MKYQKKAVEVTSSANSANLVGERYFPLLLACKVTKIIARVGTMR
jgi:hypothetical protein